jgi:hypothetical protein
MFGELAAGVLGAALLTSGTGISGVLIGCGGSVTCGVSVENWFS